ncbi:MAG: sigma 54-interacting transcriptional regulator [Spirochaetaceae bacterium]|nr:sigma 54-interacting transcriptional regulator [Spirochaetaceae bacterium]
MRRNLSMEGRLSLSPDRTLEIVLESIAELVDYELAVVLDIASPGRLEVRRARGPLASERLANFSISLARRPDLAAVLEGGVPRLFDRDDGSVDTYAEILELPEGHSCLAAPLLLEGRAVGLLTLDHRRCGVFSPGIVRFIGAISALVAVALAQSAESAGLRAEAARLAAERNRLLERDADAFRRLLGDSPAWTAVLDSIRLVAATEASVLLLGETGTGKEEAARAIHRLSPRAEGPFVALNCSALPPGLAESELFGHERGSFTGAQAQRRGRFELASGGTLFLDEAGDLPLELQPKLLRALQEGSFERVGGERPVRVDVRVVAATHVDLAAAVREGRFREDLYYRLAVFPISLPPLRERGEDVALLAERFLGELRSRPGWEDLRLSRGALEALRARPWPGNVRELKNAVERAAILARGGLIEAEELAADGAGPSGPGPLPAGRPLADSLADSLAGSRAGGPRPRPRDGATLDSALAAAERAEIESALERSRGRLYGSGGAAELLGIKPSTLQGRMKRLGVERSRFA